MFISNAIFEANRSLNFASTASQLIFGHSLTFLHLLLSATHSSSPSPPPASAASITCRPGHEPLPSLEGCGLNQLRSSSLTSEETHTPAPPLSKGMWAGISSLDGGMMEGQTQGGTHEVGGPCSASFFPPPLFDRANVALTIEMMTMRTPTMTTTRTPGRATTRTPARTPPIADKHPVTRPIPTNSPAHARAVSQEKRTTTLVVVRFSPSIFPSPTNTFNPTASTKRH